jgi:hypothetical protein
MKAKERCVMEGQEKREFPRYSLPILIDAPSLATHPLVPEDISQSGFRIDVSERPEPGDVVECSIVVNGKLFQGCRARVRWVTNNEIFTYSWAIGLSVEIDAGRRADYDAALDEVFGAMGGPRG